MVDLSIVFCSHLPEGISQLDLLGHCHAIFEGSRLLRSHVPQDPIRGIFGMPKVVRRVGVHGVLERAESKPWVPGTEELVNDNKKPWKITIFNG